MNTFCKGTNKARYIDYAHLLDEPYYFIPGTGGTHFRTAKTARSAAVKFARDTGRKQEIWFHRKDGNNIYKADVRSAKRNAG